MFKKMIQWIENNWDFVKTGSNSSKAKHFLFGQCLNVPMLIISIFLAELTGWYVIPIVVQLMNICLTIGWEGNQLYGNFSNWLKYKVLDSFNDISSANIISSIIVIIYTIVKFWIYLSYPLVYMILILMLITLGLIHFIFFVKLVKEYFV